MMSQEKFKGVMIHPTAEVNEKAEILEGTYVWNQAQVREHARVGKNCILAKDVYVAEYVVVGNNVKTQNGVSIYRGVTIEDDVFLGPHMTFTNDLTPRSFIKDYKIYPTLVRQGASVGANATIICGVTLGRYCMVGAGGVVTRDVPDHGLVLGNPARLVGFVCRCGHKLVEMENRETNTETNGDTVPMKCGECGFQLPIPREIHDKIRK